MLLVVFACERIDFGLQLFNFVACVREFKLFDISVRVGGSLDHCVPGFFIVAELRVVALDTVVRGDGVADQRFVRHGENLFLHDLFGVLDELSHAVFHCDERTSFCVFKLAEVHFVHDGVVTGDVRVGRNYHFKRFFLSEQVYEVHVAHIQSEQLILTVQLL